MSTESTSTITTREAIGVMMAGGALSLGILTLSVARDAADRAQDCHDHATAYAVNEALNNAYAHLTQNEVERKRYEVDAAKDRQLVTNYNVAAKRLDTFSQWTTASGSLFMGAGGVLLYRKIHDSISS